MSLRSASTVANPARGESSSIALLQQAVAVEPSPHKVMVGGTWAKSPIYRGGGVNYIPRFGRFCVGVRSPRAMSEDARLVLQLQRAGEAAEAELLVHSRRPEVSKPSVRVACFSWTNI